MDVCVYKCVYMDVNALVYVLMCVNMRFTFCVNKEECIILSGSMLTFPEINKTKAVH